MFVAPQIIGSCCAKDSVESVEQPWGGLWMRWVLRLVEAKGDGQSQSTDVMEIVRPDDLGNTADLGLTLAEAKVLQARVQQECVADQARGHAAQRPNCRSAPEAVIRQRTDEQQISTLSGHSPLLLL